jgi:hypothetical protein
MDRSDRNGFCHGFDSFWWFALTALCFPIHSQGPQGHSGNIIFEILPFGMPWTGFELVQRPGQCVATSGDHGSTRRCGHGFGGVSCSAVGVSKVWGAWWSQPARPKISLRKLVPPCLFRSQGLVMDTRKSSWHGLDFLQSKHILMKWCIPNCKRGGYKL